MARGIAGLVLSPLYFTEPVGGPPQPDFLNAVAAGVTRLAPLALLGFLRDLERSAGRVRTAERDGPRPLDLDLLLYGDLEIDLPGLVVPHPRLRERRFVLAPLADLRPALVVPGTGLSVERLLALAPPARVERLRPPSA